MGGALGIGTVPVRAKLNIAKKRTTGLGLLHDVSGAEIARIEWPAPGQSFVLPAIKTDAVLAKTPAKINVYVTDHRGKTVLHACEAKRRRTKVKTMVSDTSHRWAR